MSAVSRFLFKVVLCLLTLPALAAISPDLDGLVEVKAKRMDEAYLLPGADFRQYTAVIIDTPDVAFDKDWMRNMNETRTLSHRVSQADAGKIAEATRSGLVEVFQEEFRKAGYTIATAPGADVLRLSPSIVKLYINAPDVMAPDRSRTYTIDAGEATLQLKARDSVSGALLGMAIDRREARGSGFVTWTNSVTNRSDFRRLFQQWARICIKGLDELKAGSPVSPEPVQPK
ncbi:MAG: DUF3313 family protein [Gammaproteobacteria bacterium]|nr:DUF3313 family protein [Gammaproteobacteria bacterium]MCP5139271.1 DUF3313 family protein [Chromatiales bacterium]